MPNPIFAAEERKAREGNRCTNKQKVNGVAVGFGGRLGLRILLTDSFIQIIHLKCVPAIS